jgi:hypothetical protein
MHLKHLLSGALALALVTTARADVEIIITGATAFRVATLDTIKGRFNASAAAYQYAHDQAAGSFNASTRSVFKGTFPGVSGVTTIRCTFTGSTEGIRAVAIGGVDNATYLTDANLITAAAIGGGETPNRTSPTASLTAKFAFSDVRQTSSPIVSPVLNPADPRVGVVIFTMLANEGASASLTNVTSQQFKALFGKGFQPLSLFTGNAADTQLVLASGRNDGSGTRTTYLAETGYGISKPVNQYVVTASSSTNITQLQRVPQGGGATPANASTLWGNDIDGNGGYNSGSALRTDFGKTSGSVEILDADGSQIDIGVPVTLITFLSGGDAVTARVNGAKILAFNGAILSSFQTGTVLDATDTAKITEGVYTAWGYENLYYSGTLTTDQNTVYTAIKSNIPSNLGSTGIALSAMHVGREDDGGPVGP